MRWIGFLLTCIGRSGPKRGLRQISKFSDAPLLLLLLQKITFFVFLAANVDPTPFDSACIWSKFSCFLLVRTGGSSSLLTGGICKFYAGIFDN
jgi:hypothetical protein